MSNHIYISIYANKVVNWYHYPLTSPLFNSSHLISLDSKYQSTDQPRLSSYKKMLLWILIYFCINSSHGKNTFIYCFTLFYSEITIYRCLRFYGHNLNWCEYYSMKMKEIAVTIIICRCFLWSSGTAHKWKIYYLGKLKGKYAKFWHSKLIFIE